MPADLTQLDTLVADIKAKEVAFEAADDGATQANAALESAKTAAGTATDASAAARQAKDASIDALVSYLAGLR